MDSGFLRNDLEGAFSESEVRGIEIEITVEELGSCISQAMPLIVWALLAVSDILWAIACWFHRKCSVTVVPCMREWTAEAEHHFFQPVGRGYLNV